MSLEENLSAMAPAVSEVRAALGIRTVARLEDLVAAQIHSDRGEQNLDAAEVDPGALAELYELRARHLDWIYETGYLGFFASNPGMRYSFRRRLEESLALLPKGNGEDLLEVGCGAGILSLLAGLKFGRVVGTDVSETAVVFGRRLAERMEAKNVAFCKADVERLPFPDEAFSSVICGEVIGHVANPRQAAEELARVTAPGGSLLLSTPCGLSPTRAALRVASLVRPGIQFHHEKQMDRRVAAFLKESGAQSRPEKLLRVKRHYRFREVIALMRSAGLRYRRARGTALDLPPAPVIYRKLPGRCLRPLRALERALNRLRLFPRLLAISTVFLFEKPSLQGEPDDKS
jgi:ubiquinone/menaquinone biosynthesis C-methylase UbiE